MGWKGVCYCHLRNALKEIRFRFPSSKVIDIEIRTELIASVYIFIQIIVCAKRGIIEGGKVQNTGPIVAKRSNLAVCIVNGNGNGIYISSGNDGRKEGRETIKELVLTYLCPRSSSTISVHFPSSLHPAIELRC